MPMRTVSPSVTSRDASSAIARFSRRWPLVRSTGLENANSETSTAPPCTRRSRPREARASKSLRTVTVETPSSRATSEIRIGELDCSISTMRRRRSAASSFAGSSWAMLAPLSRRRRGPCALPATAGDSQYFPLSFSYACLRFGKRHPESVRNPRSAMSAKKPLAWHSRYFVTLRTFWPTATCDSGSTSISTEA